MLDPVTAIGLASSIVAFVDFSAKLVKGSIEIYQASDGTLTENRNSQAVAGAMERFAARLVIEQPSQLFGEEKELVDLAKNCHVVCLELLNLLGRIKPKDLSSKRQSLWAALKNRFHEGERKELENRLDTYRRQLELHMNFKTMISVDKLSQYVAEHSESLNPLKATVSELSAISIDTHESIRQLLNTQKAVLHASITKQILKSLKHDDMDKRHDMIEDAHEKTFQWIFDIDDGAARNDQAGSFSPAPDGWDSVDTLGSNDSDASRTNEEIQMRQESREKFLTWLSAGTGIFHISGKMGCGKSTLMKFLSHHPGTRTRLDEWASGNQLVLASFFFWRPGSDDQKSLDGLYRSLLHSVLKHHHDLIPRIFPRAWREAKERSWTTQTELTLLGDDISEAFDLLVRSENVCADYSFCFFVDGLDEYQIRTQADHMDLVERLHSWTTAFPSNVKLCVSSREEHPFMESFAEAQRLRLHTLTQYDIMAYILDRLPSSETPRLRPALAKYIIKKASGVFFWVALVVRNVRGQWYFELKPARLRKIVREFPSELDDLYRHILKKLHKSSRKMAYQTLAMLPFVNGSDTSINLDLLAYSFLEEYDLNERFAREDKFEPELSEEQKEERRQIARTMLSAWCGGLVEFDRWGDIGYAHRSVADFLGADDIQQQMATSLNGTHPVSILSELMLARWKIQGSDGDWRPGGSPYDLMVLREEHHLDHEPFEFLRSMDTIFEPELKRVDDSTLDSRIGVWTRGYTYNIASRQVKGVLGVPSVLGSKGDVHLSFAPLFFPYHETNDYVLWSIENDPRTTNTPSKAVLLFYASILTPTYPVLEILLNLNIIRPEMRTHLMPFIPPLLLKETCISSAVGESHSIWQYFLVKEFYTWLDDERYDLNHRYVGIVERFLRIGADHRFRFSILVVQWPTAAGINPETEDTFTFGDPSEPETLSFRRKWQFSVNDRLETQKTPVNPAGFDSTFSKLRTWLCEANGPRREISFTGWIRAMSDFPGRDDVLQLLEERDHNLQRVQNNQVITVQSPLEDQSVDTIKTAGKTERGTLCGEPTVLSEKRITFNWVYLTGIILGKLFRNRNQFASTSKS
ncbi:related to small s protein [Fusarium fujikuroi IMI 58289]|uniref:Related to small s protein n=1 Tax=Gibberella fujikuroi (strain CBS 195.34 / IMI 58289 / NRRL A-6831) TaxID=1279085 RepID=S0DRN0_GIBF5|nr:related to small s protein [Fusarium fujikuroi IMI 58289]CCT63223.1 related to small s protein [Fusarium fujikuroi IMI 58289]SCN71485.1 related to small s protein [Fusarium fujikuroi]